MEGVECTVEAVQMAIAAPHDFQENLLLFCYSAKSIKERQIQRVFHLSSSIILNNWKF